jgi:hypothetical protein
VGPMRWPALLGVLCLVSAGCFGGGPDDSGRQPDPTGGPPSGTRGENGTAAGATTTMEAPVWTAGQSWTWRLTGSALQDPVEGTSVVLSADGGTYEVGAADVAGGAALFPFHIVAFGAVDAKCLCWEAHGAPVQLLRFPLSNGTRFTTDFWAAPGAEVVLTAAEVAGPDGVEPGFRAVASYAGGGTFMEADYSTARGQFVRVATYFGGEQPFAEAVLVGEARDAPGIAFRTTELARFTASAADPASLAPHPLTVPDGSEVVLLACFLPGAQGFYAVELSTAGIPLACAGGSTDGTKHAGTHTEATAGPGSVTAAVGGQGSINVEVFAVDTTA